MPLHLGLPFSWSIFFFAATAFAAATALVAIRRPRLFADYVSLKEFVRAERTGAEIVCDFLTVAESPRFASPGLKRLRLDHFLDFFRTFEKDTVSAGLLQAKQLPAFAEISRGLRSARLKAGKGLEAQWLIWEVADQARLVSRLFATLLYLVGSALWTVVLVQNVLSVWRLSHGAIVP